MTDVFMEAFSVDTGWYRSVRVGIYVSDDGLPVVTLWDEKDGAHLRPSMDQSSVEFDLTHWAHLRDLYIELGNDEAFGRVIARCFSVVQQRAKEVERDA
jgi:hypothetical protein